MEPPPSSAASPRPGAGSRRRPPRACHNCARRKISCDKMRPSCSRCLRNNLTCQYAYANSAQHGQVVIIDETPAVIAENETIPNRLHHLGRLIEEHVGGHSTSASRTSSEPSSQLRYPGHLYNGSQTKSRYLSPSSFALISKEVSAINELLQAQQRQPVHGNTDEGVLYPSRTTSATSVYTNSNAQSNLARNNSGHLLGDIFPRVPAWTLLDYSPQTGFPGSSTNEILAEIPTSEQCDLLIWSFLIGWHPMIPVINVPAFLQQVRQFHHRGPDFQIPTHFLSLLTAVLFAGSVVCRRDRLQYSFGHRSREKLSTMLYGLAISANRLSDFPQAPSLQSLAAYLILDTTWLREEQPLICCSFIGVAYRAALVLGLHRDPSEFTNLSLEEACLRRHIWWNLVTIDAMIALSAGLPPLIPNKAYEVQPITTAASSQSTTPGEAGATMRAGGEPFVSLFIVGKYGFYRGICDLLHAIHKTVLDESDVDHCLEVTQKIRIDIEHSKAQITAHQTTPDLEPVPGGPSSIPIEGAASPFFPELAKMLLSMFAAKPYAVMYGPFRRHHLWDVLLQREPNAMMNCREYLHRFLQLTERNEFQPWHWCWPGRHQPLHSIMALITDLEESPNPAFVKETRQLIDLALSMCGGDNTSIGVVSNEDGEPDVRPLQGSGGHEIWSFIRRARDKCWQKAGVDPDELHCPKSVSEIRFEGYAFSDPSQEPLSGPSQGDWSYPTFASDEWAFLNQTVLDWDWELNSYMDHE